MDSGAIIAMSSLIITTLTVTLFVHVTLTSPDSEQKSYSSHFGCLPVYCQYYSFVAGFEPVFCALRLTSGGSGGASVCEWLKEEDSYEGIERRSPNRLERGKKNPGGGSRQEAYSDSELEDPTYYPSGLRPRTKSNTKMSHKKSRREDTEDVEQAGPCWSF